MSSASTKTKRSYDYVDEVCRGAWAGLRGDIKRVLRKLVRQAVAEAFAAANVPPSPMLQQAIAKVLVPR